jgi:hypothetical protein
MDKIATVQDRLYTTLLDLDRWRELLPKKTKKIDATQESNFQIVSAVDTARERDIWEKVYGKTGDVQDLPDSEAQSVKQVRQSVWDSLKGIQFDIIRDDFATVDKRLDETVRYLREWRKLLPDKAKPASTHVEWMAKKCRELGEEAIRKEVENSGRLKGLVDEL